MSAHAGGGLKRAADAQDAASRGALPQQERLRRMYDSPLVQMTVAAAIFINFALSALEKQLLPEAGSAAFAAFYGFEVFFAALFGVELAWNLYANWFAQFWRSGWNWFDFLIVTITFVSMSSADLPGISVLRLFRAFRVFRLFKRVESLRIILEGVGAALPGVANAFMILGILMGIWAIIGVEFFGEAAPQEFGRLFNALLTMWQVMTLDGWSSDVGRPLLEQGLIAAVPFFVTFSFIAGIVMTNVVVAILLDTYLTATADNDKRKAKAAAAKRRKGPKGAAGAEPLPGGKLGKEELIDLIIDTCKRKNLQDLSKDEVISLALVLWYQPCMREAVPLEMRVGMRVSPDHQSRSIVLNTMQKGMLPPAGTGPQALDPALETQ